MRPRFGAVSIFAIRSSGASAPRSGGASTPPTCDDGVMLTDFSNQIADVVDAVAPSVVQVQGGHRRPVSGLAYAADAVVTTARAVGGDDHPRVRRADGAVLEAELLGIDPATQVALLKVPGLEAPPLTPGTPARVGHLAVAVARSWSNGVTATAGLVSIIGGPLATGRRRAIEQVIRTSAPMHEGFAGGAFVGVSGELLGLATAASIRGLGVVIPASIAWRAAGELLRRGSTKRGYLGIGAQTVPLPHKQREVAGAAEALLIVDVKDGSPAADAGLLVGDLLLALDGQAVASPEDLLDRLSGERVGRLLPLRLLRGGAPADVGVTVGER
jgi:serine protease DegQ